MRRHEKDFADNFENLVKEFDNFIDPDKIHKFYQLVPNQDEKQREYYEKVYRKYWSIEMERYKCLSKPNEAGKDTLNEAESEKGTNKMDLINSFKFFTIEALKKYTDEGVGEIPEKDIKHLVDKIMRRGFKFLFGRSDHRLVASLVKAIWDMKKEGDWKIAYVPRYFPFVSSCCIYAIVLVQVCDGSGHHFSDLRDRPVSHNDTMPQSRA